MKPHRLWTREDGLGTLEIVIIISVLLTVAMLFRSQLTAFANALFRQVFNHNVLG